MTLSRSPIEKTKRRFFVYSAIGLLFITAISIAGLMFYNQAAHQQELMQDLNLILRNQIRLVNDISNLGDSIVDDNVDRTKYFEIKAELESMVLKLKSENTKLNDFFESNNANSIKTIEEIQELAQEKDMFDKMDVFLKQADEIVEDNSISFSELRTNINYLSRTSQYGLRKVFRFISNKLYFEQERALSQLRIVGMALILVCVFLIVLVWSTVFRPLYNEVIVKHRDLTDALIKADMANRSKTDFLANISHEIRTPMTAILGYADLMKKDELTKEEKIESINVINQNASHLLSLIDEILDISKIEAGKLTFEKEAVVINDILSEVYSLINVKAEEKGIDLFFNSKGNIPQIIITDEKRLKQILFNIVGNAIKFTQKGYVELTVNFKEAERDLIFEVKDTGCGIPQKSVKKLFKPFSQADTSGSRQHQGTGLGLVLSRKIAQGLGGDVVIKETSIGHGSTFQISIDVGEYSSKPSDINVERRIQPRKGDELEDLQGSKVLIVDDAKENARLFKIYLEAAKANIELAHDGLEAVEKAKTGNFDMIFMDLQMPGMDGFQAIRELRKNNFNKPIVALTAHALNEEVEKTRKAGFNDHVSKPVSAETLVRTCFKHLNLG